MEHEIYGVKFSSKDVQSLTVKRDGMTIIIEKDSPGSVIAGFATKKPTAGQDEPDADLNEEPGTDPQHQSAPAPNDNASQK